MQLEAIAVGAITFDQAVDALCAEADGDRRDDGRGDLSENDKADFRALVAMFVREGLRSRGIHARPPNALEEIAHAWFDGVKTEARNEFHPKMN